MFDLLPADQTWIVGAAVVAVLVAARLYAGPGPFGRDVDRITWQPLRRALVPIIHRLARRFAGADWYAESRVHEHEHVASVGLEPESILDVLSEAGSEPQPLASVATDWTGRTEVASWARYHGPKPFPGAPDWLRKRQDHVRLFEREPFPDGTPRTAITAHAEVNPWRFWGWRKHYRGIGKRAAPAVGRLRERLGVHPGSGAVTQED